VPPSPHEACRRPAVSPTPFGPIMSSSCPPRHSDPPRLRQESEPAKSLTPKSCWSAPRRGRFRSSAGASGDPSGRGPLGSRPGVHRRLLIGSRFADPDSGLELLVTKTGEGSLSADGISIPLKEAKAASVVWLTPFADRPAHPERRSPVQAEVVRGRLMRGRMRAVRCDVLAEVEIRNHTYYYE
jgi:hypothetical protein